MLEDVFILHLRDGFFQLGSCNLCITTGDVLHNSIMNECKLLLHCYKSNATTIVMLCNSCIVYVIVLLWTHIVLNHFHSSLSDLGDDSWDVHHLLFLYLLQNVVKSYISTRAPNASTVNKNRDTV